MGRKDRLETIGRLTELRGGRLQIAYVTSTRANHEVQMGDDVVRLLYDHLEAQKSSAEIGVDLFIYSNGGSGTVPWRLVNLIREYTEKFSVLVPHRAFSAATLLALGADEIVMHRMGCLGPIDPSVANFFNPPHPNQPGLPAPINVEDVSAYIKMIKEEIGITHEDELIGAVIALTDKIHPLALGNVQRSHSQSRMMARKLLKLHKGGEEEHRIDEIIDNLKSNLFFHGHPINRREAKRDLNLNIAEPPEELEKTMWDLYTDYEQELKLAEPFFPILEFENEAKRKQNESKAGSGDAGTEAKEPAKPAEPSTPEQPAQGGPLVMQVPQMPPFGPFQPPQKVRLEAIKGAILESIAMADVFKTDLTIERSVVNTQVGPQEVTKQEVICQRWIRESV